MILIYMFNFNCEKFALFLNFDYYCLGTEQNNIKINDFNSCGSDLSYTAEFKANAHLKPEFQASSGIRISFYYLTNLFIRGNVKYF